jgi:hypothetical protein
LWDKFSHQIKNSETVKALLLSTCRPTRNHPRFVGFGIPNEDELFFSRFGVVRIVFEGVLPLSGKALGADIIPADEVKVFVPADVATIEVFLVHSDNYRLSPFPRLNTYLGLAVEKPGKRGKVRPSFGMPSSQTHVKHLVYRYKRNVKGDWFFRIIPHGIGIPVRERENVTIRYGGVIKLIAKEARFRLGDSIVRGLRRGGNIQINPQGTLRNENSRNA